MHEVSFRLKRAHLRAVEMHKPLARLFDLTPARFDVLFLIRTRGGDCLQSFLWQRLGLSAATMCRMLEAMEDKGLVWREDCSYDRRQRTVGLTKYGFECLVGAIKMFLRSETLRKVYDALYPGGRGFVRRAVDILRKIGRGLFDTSQHKYALDAPDTEALADDEAFDEQVRRDVERLEAHRVARARGEPFAEPAAMPRLSPELEELLRPGYWDEVNKQRYLDGVAREAARKAAEATPTSTEGEE